MAEVVKKVEKKFQIETYDWTEEEAREFLVKGGIVRTKVTNYDKDDNITSYCISEKQIVPNYKLHLVEKKEDKINKFKELKKELK